MSPFIAGGQSDSHDKGSCDRRGTLAEEAHGEFLFALGIAKCAAARAFRGSPRGGAPRLQLPPLKSQSSSWVDSAVPMTLGGTRAGEEVISSRRRWGDGEARIAGLASAASAMNGASLTQVHEGPCLAFVAQELLGVLGQFRLVVGSLSVLLPRCRRGSMSSSKV